MSTPACLHAQAQLAEISRIDQGSVSRSEGGRDADFSTIDRLLAGAGHRLYSAPTRRDDAATAAAEIRHQLRGEDKDRALRALVQLNDNLLAEHGLIRGILGLAEPESTRDPVWDAAIAALVAWRLTEEGIPLPAWVDHRERFLATFRTLELDPADPVPPLSAVPDAFAARGAAESRRISMPSTCGRAVTRWSPRRPRGWPDAITGIQRG